MRNRQLVEGKVDFQEAGIFGEAGSKTAGKSGQQESAGINPLCPQCGSSRLYRDGFRYLADGSSVQRWLCRNCAYRFSEKPLQRESELSINTTAALTSNCQIFAPAKEAKNLEHATETKTVAGEFAKTKPLPAEAKGAIAKFQAFLEREGYASNSAYPNYLSTLVRRGANLTDPEDIKEKVAKQNWNDSTKMLAVHAYDLYCQMEGIQWKMPHYRQSEATIFLPDSEREFDQLIACCRSRRLRAFLQALRETYADPSEILGLEWKDIKDDTISINKPCKGHRPGVMPVSPGCIAMLRALPRTDKRIFPVSYPRMYVSFSKMRARAAKQLQNEQLLNINFKTFRHWEGSQIAMRTNGNGLLTIQRVLRHKEIKSTLKYIHNIPTYREIEYEIATATTREEIVAFGKGGFEKYDEAHGVHYYRRVPRKR